MPEIRYGKAINQALHDAMTDDPAVILFGEDVGEAGGPFKATRGLLETFGAGRVRDTPISEAAIAGMAVGAALSGLRPVAENMRSEGGTGGKEWVRTGRTRWYAVH